VAGGGALAVVILLWLALMPLRANAAARAGDVAAAAGDARTALASYERATRLLSGEPSYWLRLGVAQERLRRPGDALRSYRRGLHGDARSVALLRNAERVAEGQGKLDVAAALSARLVLVDPYTPPTVTQAATFWTKHGQPAKAVAALKPALTRLPHGASLLVALGDAQAAQNDRTGAANSYRQALASDPAATGAQEGLKAIGAA
jgi:tetratricopeptide (TPR) repeat protein